MARPALHSVDAMLDAARTLLLEHGVEHTTIQAIAAASGAPVGSLYNRFGSRAELLARLWLRAAGRSQAACLPLLEAEPLQAVLEVVRRLLAFTRSEPHDARLLASFRREDLLGASESLNASLAGLNEPVDRAVKELAKQLFGSARGEGARRVRLAMLELPLAAVRSYLLAGRAMPADLDPHVLRAARAILTD
ncbi:MAG TPA: helix-turn-helix domain-containing protein [Polyangiales bacterium]|nr:helix-turn-helix domain-containing protein [Polyangiales bacterium]